MCCCLAFSLVLFNQIEHCQTMILPHWPEKESNLWLPFIHIMCSNWSICSRHGCCKYSPLGSLRGGLQQPERVGSAGCIAGMVGGSLAWQTRSILSLCDNSNDKISESPTQEKQIGGRGTLPGQSYHHLTSMSLPEKASSYLICLNLLLLQHPLWALIDLS